MRQIGVGDFQVTPKMRELLDRTLRANRLSYGPLCREFETRFAKLHKCDYAVLSSSGTDSLQVAVQALKEIHGWNDGDEVIVPAVTFVATVNVVLHNNLTPVLVDVEPDFYCMDMRKVMDAVTNRTVCAIPVHLFGQMADMATLLDILILQRVDEQISIIEDSCECMFSHHWGKPPGCWGDIACFSTYVAHILTTGVGGIATTNNKEYAVKMRSLVNHGRDGIYISIDDDDNKTEAELKEIITRRFSFESIGHSSRLTEMEGALGVAQLDHWGTIIHERQTNAGYLHSNLTHLSDRIQLPELRPATSHSFMMFPIVLRDGDKWELCNHLEQNGIETREMMRLTDQPCYKGMWNPDDYPVAKWINEQGFYTACHPGLSRDDLDYMIRTIEEYFK